VTKLSLLLRVLQGEKSLVLIHNERALPDLAANIKRGNSLIGPDFYKDRQSTFDEDERDRVNVFNWRTEFARIIKEGGFDAVVGNPPYVRIQTLKDTQPESIPYFARHYRGAQGGNYDIYVLFVEQALNLLNDQGMMGYILPHKFFNAQYGEPPRSLIAKGRHLAQVVHFGHQQVFAGATTYTCLLFLEKAGSEDCRFIKVDDLNEWRTTGQMTEAVIPASKITAAEWNFAVGSGASLYERLSATSLKLGDVADIFVGLQTSADDVFIMDFVAEAPQTLRLASKILQTQWVFEKELLHPLVSGADVKRYRDLPGRQRILFPYRVEGEKAELIDFGTISRQHPRTAAYLLQTSTTTLQASPVAFGYVFQFDAHGV
jgi:hypothetical protein